MMKVATVCEIQSWNCQQIANEKEGWLREDWTHPSHHFYPITKSLIHWFIWIAISLTCKYWLFSCHYCFIFFSCPQIYSWAFSSQLSTPKQNDSGTGILLTIYNMLVNLPLAPPRPSKWTKLGKRWWQFHFAYFDTSFCSIHRGAAPQSNVN